MTTYAPPPRYEHGDILTDSDAETATTTPLEPLNTALNAIAEIISDGSTPAAAETLPKWNPAVYWNREKDSHITGQNNQNSDYYFVHRLRYLHYKSTGTIEDVAGAETAVALTDDATYNVYDLDTVSWLNYGMVYKVAGVDFCCEDYEP